MRSSVVVSSGLWVGVALLGLVSAFSACGGRTVLLLESGDAGVGTGLGTGTGIGTGPGTGIGTGPGTGSGPGTGGGSGPGTGFGSGSGSACEGLATCCTELPVMDQDACEEIVSLNIAADCNEALVAFEEAGFCEEGTSGSGSGSEPESAACEALSECCMGIPTGNPAEALCTEGSVSPSTCSADLQALNDMQLCGSPPPIFDAGVPTGVCGALARCCMTLPATEQPSCQTIAASDDQMACNTTLQAEQRAGMCEPRPP